MRARTALRKSICSICTAATIGSVFVSFPAYAADIPSLVINMQETKGEAGEVWEAEPCLSGGGCEITDYEWSYDRGSWKPGKKVSVTVTVQADEGNSFTKNTNVVVVNGEKSTAKRKGSDYVVQINYTPKVQLAQPTGIYYEDETTLCWEEVEYAGGYEVQIKQDGNFYKTVSVQGKNTTECDLSEYITDDYLYTCSVRAVAPSNKGFSIIASDWVDFDNDGVSMSGQSTTAGEFIGTGEYRQFLVSDGTRAQEWQSINGTWYYFDPENNCYAIVNKQAEIGGNHYSFDENGRMVIGWRKEADGFWYYYSADVNSQPPFGAAKTGWIQSAPTSPWYYLNDGSVSGYPYGAMLVNTVTPDGYSVNENGEWIQ